MHLLGLLGTVNGNGVSVDKGTLEVLVLLLAAIILVLWLLRGSWWHK